MSRRPAPSNGYSYTPHIRVLEDRMSPGDMGIGAALGCGVLQSPSFDALSIIESAPVQLVRFAKSEQGVARTPSNQLVEFSAPQGGSASSTSVALGESTAVDVNPAFRGALSTRSAPALISEFRRDQIGTDNDEYFELVGTPGEDLSPYTYIVIGDSGANSGIIEAVVPLSGSSIPGDGYFLAAESTFTLGTPDLSGPGNFLNFENGDNVTHMLVSGFSGTDGLDLDTDDNGVLETTPWTSIDDCVAVIGLGGTFHYTYCTQKVGPESCLSTQALSSDVMTSMHSPSGSSIWV